MRTEDIKNMTKEELVNAIVETDRRGRELEKTLNELVEVYNRIPDKIEKVEADIERGVNAMYELAAVYCELKSVLRDKYGTFVM